MQAMKFAIGASGYVGFIVPSKVQGWIYLELKVGRSNGKHNLVCMLRRPFIYLESSR